MLCSSTERDAQGRHGNNGGAGGVAGMEKPQGQAVGVPEDQSGASGLYLG